MKKYKVIFDTNFIWNSGADVVSGNKDELSKFEKHCEIIIPDMVIRELRQQRWEALISHEDKLKSNFFYKKFKSDSSISLPSIDIEQEVLKIEQNYRGNYKIISLSSQENAFVAMQKLALRKLPPFKKGTDAGFKDAYIYFTILEYAVSQVGKTIFVVTDDSTLKVALEKHDRIKVVKNYEEFMLSIVAQYDDEYFIEQIKSHLDDQSVTSKNLLDLWKNTEGNDVLLLESKKQENVLVISEREIYDHALFSEVQNAKNALINSGSFAATRHAVARLESYVKYLSDDDIKEILNACLYENEQISSIASDEDVKQFILDLSANKQHLLDDWTKDFIEKL